MPILARDALLRAVVAVGRRCFYCGARAAHADHVVPLFEGGADKASNLVPACAKCNCTKGKKRLAPALEKRALFTAFIDAPLVEEVAAHLLAVANLRRTDDNTLQFLGE